MNAYPRLAAAGAVLVILATGPAAHAAKGVKNNANPNGQTTLSGEVLSVHPAAGKAAANGTGTFQLRTARRHKKHGLTANASTAANHEIQVTPATRFEHAHGSTRSPASFASLHSRDYATVHMQGQQAQRVQIASHSHGSGTLYRHVPRQHHARYMAHHAGSSGTRHSAAAVHTKKSAKHRK